jgi:hypothetical protein
MSKVAVAIQLFLLAYNARAVIDYTETSVIDRILSFLFVKVDGQLGNKDVRNGLGHDVGG